ncbi:hydrogenase maturation protease [Halochromatium salexigens]|uniref:hydrogenase maturation protease n=1 Tax=Halochromatium salexigens TaxID=49447 RepID=UPI0030B83B0B
MPQRDEHSHSTAGGPTPDAEGTATVHPSSTTRPLRALVIGYGSPIRGDDALGPLVADQLETRVSADPELSAQVDVQARHILTAELVDDLARAERVIFIDAAANLPPGEVSRQRLAPDASALSTMAHFHDPRELLAWCQALYQRVPETWLVSAGGADWGYACYALSETAQTAVAPMIAEVLSLIGAEPDIPDTGP